MGRQPPPLPWTRRWWRRPGDSIWSAVIEGARWEAELAEVERDTWWVDVRRDGALVGDHVGWAVSQQELESVAIQDQPDELPAAVVDALHENFAQRSRGIRGLSPIALEILEQSVQELKYREWISGRKLRQRLQIEDLPQFLQHLAHLVPRYLRIDPTREGDFYSPTLAGLFRNGSEVVLQTLNYLIAALVRRYERDPDARSYDWADLAAVGLKESNLKLAWDLASIALLSRGGGMAEGGSEPSISLGMPLDAEQIVIASRTRSFEDYLLHAANLARDGVLYGPLVDRPWPSAPACLGRDGALEDYVALAHTGERRAWSFARSSTSSAGAASTPRGEQSSPKGGALPFQLQQVRLTAVRGFTHLEIQLQNPTEDSGQWVMILGTNGSGKTSILRAITLALSPDEIVQALLGHLGTSAPMVRLGADKAQIQMTSPAGRLPQLVLQPSETGDILADRGSGDVGYPFVVAYGCRRGSALGGAAREVNTTSPLGAVATLFDEGAGLVHAETWLKERKFAAVQQGGADEAFYGAIEATLVGRDGQPGLLPGITTLHVTADLVEAEGPAIGRIPFGALSDGYLTTAGWILDLIARWSEYAKRQNLVLDGSFSRRMTGIAIVDEIDLHLHPQWQRDVIDSVRQHFPRMSFFVTTHNPLTLLGGRAGEIYVLEREEATGQFTARQRDVPLGAGAEHILTGYWFGLDSTLDKDTLGLLERHRQFLRAGAERAVEAKALEEELAKRLGAFSVTSVERLAHSAAAQVLDAETRHLTAADREAALAKIVEIMRAPRRSKKGSKPAKRRTR